MSLRSARPLLLLLAFALAVAAGGVLSVALCAVEVVSPVGGVAPVATVGVALDGTAVGGTSGGGVGVGAWKVDGDMVAADLALVNQS